MGNRLRDVVAHVTGVPEKLPPRREKTLVVAETYNQYVSFLHTFALDPRDYVYVPDIVHLQGIHERKVILTGTWWNTEVGALLCDQAYCKARELSVEVKEY